jgi:hypothetical protein
LGSGGLRDGRIDEGRHRRTATHSALGTGTRVVGRAEWGE